MQLTDWLTQHHLTDAQFAEIVGADKAQVGRWKLGAVPLRHHLVRIAEFTDGAVTPNDFYRITRSGSRRRRSRKLKEDPAAAQ